MLGELSDLDEAALGTHVQCSEPPLPPPRTQANGPARSSSWHVSASETTHGTQGTGG